MTVAELGVIPDETVEQVRETADIVQIIGEYVKLKRQGTDYRGPCPFHQGTHRNFSVSPKKRMYHCFVCHEGGDVFHFLQKRLGVEWPEAVQDGRRESPASKCARSTRGAKDPTRASRSGRSTRPRRRISRRCSGTIHSAHRRREYLDERDISREVADSSGSASRRARSG